VTFVPAHELIQHGTATTHTAFVLHGIFGTGRNWKGFADRYARTHPSWRIVLVHLRGHGQSRDAPPPHDLAACVRDLDALADDVGPPKVIWGHSFGGKVALRYVRDGRHTLSAAWILDAPPGAGPPGGGDPVSSEVGRVLDFVDRLPLPVARRSQVQAALLRQGLSRPVAGWMAGNLVPDGRDGFRWHFDPSTIRHLLADYWRTDLWAVAAAPPEGTSVHLVRAEDSDRWTPDDVRRLSAIDSPPRVHAHTLPGAGHWLHIDNPDGLLALLSGG
jgi:pimeloyl-ACP methyl ester carboxylesterase